ncbi:hypothetical protein JOF53_004930 [Crossiella equi]|uniref:DUF3558 domain-containing protein n=1 Tax=Crossiella equi TaxID=130796 RepID=A0ABS5AHL0_9PSEU|nr:hypothetical protein [Crossiella equi]MBP2476058.1 hypothetical protein [Crossiella equi]
MPATSRLLLGGAAVLALAVSGCATPVSGTPVAASNVKTTTAKPTTSTRPGQAPEPDTGSETAVALMRKIQAGDVCALHDESFLKKFGSKVIRTPGPGFHGCTGIGGEPNGQHFWLFELKVGEPYRPSTREPDKVEQVGGRDVFFPKAEAVNGVEDTCYAKTKLAGTDFVLSLRARMVPNQGQPAPWPERCQEAGAYAALLGPRADDLPARTGGEPESRLLGKDPCAKKDQIVALYPDWQLESSGYLSPYDCQLKFGQADKPLQLVLTLAWDRDDEPSDKTFGDQRLDKIDVGGFPGQRLSSAGKGSGGSCKNTLVVKPGQKDVKFSAHLVRVGADTSRNFKKPASQEPIPAPDCAQVDQATQLVVSGI